MRATQTHICCRSTKLLHLPSSQVTKQAWAFCPPKTRTTHERRADGAVLHALRDGAWRASSCIHCFCVLFGHTTTVPRECRSSSRVALCKISAMICRVLPAATSTMSHSAWLVLRSASVAAHALYAGYLQGWHLWGSKFTSHCCASPAGILLPAQRKLCTRFFKSFGKKYRLSPLSHVDENHRF
jgi:hypothetical protein